MWSNPQWKPTMEVWLRKAIEAVVQRCFVENMFLKISQILQENTSAVVSF